MYKKLYKISLALLLAVGFALTSCDKDVSDVQIYSGTQTIEDFLQEHNEELSMFNEIMARTGYDRQMKSYGEYTCFAPTNAGIKVYLDSLWNDPEAIISHNGMTENSVEGMSDSLCQQFVKYHLVDGEYKTLDMTGDGMTIPTMLGTSFTAAADAASGNIVFNGSNATLNVDNSQGYCDNELTNGYVQIIDNPIPYTARRIPDVLKREKDANGKEKYSFFYEALVKTGLADSLLISDKGKTWTSCDPDYNDTNGDALYFPKECKVGFTLFVESDDVMRTAGIHDWESFVNYCITQYANSKDWYSYLNEKGITVSTDTDYTNRFNVVNMFVAYHILYASMAADQLVFEDAGSGITDTSNPWNYVWGGEPYDYYQTMLPNTLLKIWQPLGCTREYQSSGLVSNTKTNYINRWIKYNTLTDEIGTMGTASMHNEFLPGVRVLRGTNVLRAYNGYIHPISGMLVYNSDVPNKVLNERLRFESTTFLPEFINNGIRNASQAYISSLNSGGSGARVAFPQDYFDGVKTYTKGSTLRYNVRGAFRAYQADAFQGWGQYDLAVRIPPVPTGDYELRIFYSPMSHGGMMQFYLGTSNNPQTMQALSVPLDVRIDESDARIGWTDASTEDDAGVASDITLRNHGYMRAPMSFRGHPGNDQGQHTSGKIAIEHDISIADFNALITGDNNCRTDGTTTLRRILTRQTFYQSINYWFRIKSVINDDTDLKWQIDFIELVPLSVINNDKFSEDWY